MRDEYDFTRGERGKFYRPNATMQLPIYLDDQVLSWFSDKAARKGVPVNDLVNDVLKKEIAVIDAIE